MLLRRRPWPLFPGFVPSLLTFDLGQVSDIASEDIQICQLSEFIRFYSFLPRSFGGIVLRCCNDRPFSPSRPYVTHTFKGSNSACLVYPDAVASFLLGAEQGLVHVLDEAAAIGISLAHSCHTDADRKGKLERFFNASCQK